ncbi:unnamed protein product [Caenorhabditis angaria]|uniref:Uncharacterized protein n=1 Tax=Caenorhabditis angaria TaxID=860376 RepID=A0A9P1I6Y3_9PELO|nr:unnamed protein product [Caenorhabditis angaria]
MLAFVHICINSAIISLFLIVTCNTKKNVSQKCPVRKVGTSVLDKSYKSEDDSTKTAKSRKKSKVSKQHAQKKKKSKQKKPKEKAGDKKKSSQNGAKKSINYTDTEQTQTQADESDVQMTQADSSAEPRRASGIRTAIRGQSMAKTKTALSPSVGTPSKTPHHHHHGKHK